MIRRVNADFVPVALKAGLVDLPPGDEEGKLYREIRRSRPAPQGICVVNSAGKVLDWALWFDDDNSVLAFLDRALNRYAEFPDAQKPPSAERYAQFPSRKLEDIADNGKVVAVAERHPEGRGCPAKPRVPRGTLEVRMFGRAIGKDDKPVADVLHQENYAEDHFHLPIDMQETFAKSLAAAGNARFRLTGDPARLFVSHAFLGELDVNPLGAGTAGKNELEHIELRARKVGTGVDGLVYVHIEGESEAAGVSNDDAMVDNALEKADGKTRRPKVPADRRRTDGPAWRHKVKLTWEGMVEMKGDRISRLVLLGQGVERLARAHKFPELMGQVGVTGPPGAHMIDLDCPVRYGFVCEPVPDQDAIDPKAVAAPNDPALDFPDEARRELVEFLGGPFLVFRDAVLDDLEIAGDRKQKLLAKFPDYRHETMSVFEKTKELQPADREKELEEHRRNVRGKLAAFLEVILDADRIKRLRQLELQKEGLFALLGEPELGDQFKISNDQRNQMMNVILHMQAQIEPLMKQVASGGDPDRIRPRVTMIRKEHEDRIMTLLSDAQRRQWNEMLGKPLHLSD